MAKLKPRPIRFPELTGCFVRRTDAQAASQLRSAANDGFVRIVVICDFSANDRTEPKPDLLPRIYRSSLLHLTTHRYETTCPWPLSLRSCHNSTFSDTELRKPLWLGSNHHSGPSRCLLERILRLADLSCPCKAYDCCLRHPGWPARSASLHDGSHRAPRR